jgi:hypothetical protein
VNATAQLSCEGVLEALARTLAPYLGQTMARAAVEAHRQKLDIDGRHITADQVEALLGRIGVGLVIFVGRSRTESIVQEARAAVDALVTHA